MDVITLSSKYNVIVIDLETTAQGYEMSPSASYRNNYMLVMGCYTSGEAKPFVATDFDELLKRISEGYPKVPLFVGHNLKFDLGYLMRQLPKLHWHKYRYWDTAMCEYLLSGHSSKFPGLSNTCDANGVSYRKSLDLGALLKSGVKMTDIPMEELESYVKDDVMATLRLFQSQIYPMNESECEFIFWNCANLASLTSIELNGMHFDVAQAHLDIEKHTKALEVSERFMFDHLAKCGVFTIGGKRIDVDEYEHIRKFLNVTSNKTVSAVLSGRPSTLRIGTRKADKRVLEVSNPLIAPDEIESFWGDTKDNDSQLPVTEAQLQKIKKHADTTSDMYAFVTELLTYRSISKDLNTYLGPLTSRAIFDGDNKVYTNLHTTSTHTGRLSSSSPNFQNMPATIRPLFFTEHPLFELDFKQLELCALAQLTGDEQLIEDITNGTDIHYEIGKTLFGWETPSDMDEKSRRLVKSVVFGTVYGGGATTLSVNVGAAVSKVSNIIHAFFSRYPGIKKYYKLMEDMARRYKYPDGHHSDGHQRYATRLYVESFGPKAMHRCWLLHDEKSPDFVEEDYTFSPTKIKNYPVQGTAGGDIVLSFLKVLYYLIGGEQSDIRLVNTVHDSILASVPSHSLDKFNDAVKVAVKYVEEVYTLKVPLTVSVKGNSSTNNWS